MLPRLCTERPLIYTEEFPSAKEKFCAANTEGHSAIALPLLAFGWLRTVMGTWDMLDMRDTPG
jgi:hypothetical protein